MLNKEWKLKVDTKRVIVGDIGTEDPSRVGGVGTLVLASVVYKDDDGTERMVPMMTTVFKVDEKGDVHSFETPMPPDLVAHIIDCHNAALENRKI